MRNVNHHIINRKNEIIMFGQGFDEKLRNMPPFYELKTQKNREEQLRVNQETEENMTTEFKFSLHKAYGSHLTIEAHELLWEIAYANGHSAGFEAIEHEYVNKLRFFDIMTEANKG